MRGLRKEGRRASLTLFPALLVIGLLALGCAGTASATVLCKTATDPCTGGTYAKGTVLEASLKSGTKWKLVEGVGTLECGEAAIKGAVTNPGPEGPVAGSVSSLSFGKCNNTVEVLKTGTFRIGSPSGSNGTLTLEGFEIKSIIAGVECIYGGPASISLTGGEMASAKASSTLTKTSGIFLCVQQAEWTAEFTVTAPEPLYVSSS